MCPSRAQADDDSSGAARVENTRAQRSKRLSLRLAPRVEQQQRSDEAHLPESALPQGPGGRRVPRVQLHGAHMRSGCARAGIARVLRPRASRSGNARRAAGLEAGRKVCRQPQRLLCLARPPGAPKAADLSVVPRGTAVASAADAFAARGVHCAVRASRRRVARRRHTVATPPPSPPLATSLVARSATSPASAGGGLRDVVRVDGEVRDQADEAGAEDDERQAPVLAT
jgi:hypothetical protein